METVRDERRGDVAWLTINRPRQRNALSAEAVRGLRAGLSRVKADAGVRAVVLAGAGDRYFSAGGDLREMNDGPSGVPSARAGQPADEPNPLDSHRERSELNGIFDDLQSLGKPTIARVCGLALAGGFGIALGCDFIVASFDAEFGLPEARVGLWPYIVTESLLHWMPPKAALQLMLTGRRVTAEEGRRLGFIYDIAPTTEVDARIDQLVDELRAGSPEAIFLGRSAFYRAINAEPGARMAMLESTLTVNLGLPDAREGISAFLERRPPRWNRTT